MKGNTGKSEHGQMIAWITSVAAELPRIGMDIEEKEAQELIAGTENDGREKLNALLWKAAGTRRRVVIDPIDYSCNLTPFRDEKTRVEHLDQHFFRPPFGSWFVFFANFPARRLAFDMGDQNPDYRGSAAIELMCFDNIFSCLSGPIVKAHYRGFCQPLYEDAIFFGAKAKPSQLRMEGKMWPVVFPHQVVHCESSPIHERCIALYPMSDDRWRMGLVGYHERLPRQCFYAFREQ